MHVQLFSRICTRQLRTLKNSSFPIYFPTSPRSFHTTTKLQAVNPFLLADIGEGIRECEIIQWFVEPEAFVEEFDKLCEVQSDKASVEITSRFAGVIKKLHYEAGDMAQVGKPLVDIDIQGAIKEDELAAIAETTSDKSTAKTTDNAISEEVSKASQTTPSESEKEPKPKGTHAALATPAVRHLTKELKVNLADINGTGRDGRVLKDDVHQFVRQRDAAPTSSSASSSTSSTSTAASESGPQTETITQLTNMQQQMFKSMTKSLAIPHFLYADEMNFNSLSKLRPKLNKVLASDPQDGISKLSFLPFVIKAVSIMLHQYPTLNARVHTDSKTSKPVLVHRSQHNIGIAMDTPVGLLVPVIKNVSSLSILGIASELNRLQSLAQSGKLSPSDITGGTITVSNIGNIGGTTLSPVIIDGQVAILGMGRTKTIPAFNDEGELVKKHVCNFSWSADHRVVDGATMARAGKVVQDFVENPERMVVQLR
ncbi:2-oxoacid dehydrogenases acyltransferase-domain-containing protein [Calycina marina]|uniref:Dihydrolipoamide acetyltransferase component of pyruvate dehydrogenase complex n=1 Tax=Calycina marina TaxID=1763456 RepID=A0A9P7Z7I1_9HELO|nr:2-oxoacid dehydrogenases acyltransferase-domain-containing protein [Calycina marina]